MKKIISLLSLILFFTVALKAQTTISIPDTNINTTNTVVQFPVSSSGALSVYSVTLNISYDPSVLEYQAINNNPFENVGVYISTIDTTNGLISIAWFNTSKVDITDKLFDLQFLYKGGSSAISFTGTKELTDINGTPFNITFVNGSIAPFPLSLSLSSVTGAIGDTLTIDLSGASLNDIGSMSLFINYDTSAAEYVSISDPTLIFTVGTTIGQVNLAMLSIFGTTFTDGSIVKLKFVVKGGSTALTFDALSNITDVSGNTLTTVFTNGQVSESGATFSLATVATAIDGTNISVSLSAESISDLASFTIHIAYDTTVADYVSVDNLISGSIIASASNGVLNLAWFDTTPVNITPSTKFADIVFLYHGGSQSTALTLTADEFTDFNGANIAVTLVSGSISGVTGVEEISSKIPDNYALSQNYPNPFNPSTTINFALKVTSQVSINIYNSLGQRVVNLVNGSFSAGFKSIKFNASNLASGIYIYRIIATGIDGSQFLQAKKMILMK